MSGSQFFGSSLGSLASMASSGQAGTYGGPSCGSAGAGASPFVCGQPLQGMPSVSSQPYTPGPSDFATTPSCIVLPVV